MSQTEAAMRNPFIPIDHEACDEVTAIELTIQRDLAVQIVGSDAGEERRFRPTATMTRGVAPADLAHVGSLTRPFLEAKVHRFHTNRSERMAELKVTATANEARALLQLCTNYATHLQKHWDQSGHDARHHRSKQRLDQTRAVIQQINRGFGLGDDDGRTPLELRGEAKAKLQQLIELVATLIDRAKRVTNDNPEVALSHDEIQFWQECLDELAILSKDAAVYE